jgi:hypothetical protein
MPHVSCNIILNESVIRFFLALQEMESESEKRQNRKICIKKKIIQ